MRRFFTLSASVILLSSLFLGCHRAPKKDDDAVAVVPPVDVNVKVVPPAAIVGPKKNGDAPASAIDAAKQEKYEATLVSAMVAMADHKYKDALAAFQTAQKIQDNDFVRGEIAKLQQRLAQDGAAQQTVKNIETVLNDGSADEAAKLAADALKEFGDGAQADKLAELKLQADALKNAEKPETKQARYARFKKEGEAALDEKNLRAAALAFEQALLAQMDADLQKIYDGIRGKLDTYDALRKKAAELRKDPLQIDDAIAALKEAKAAWDTLMIRQLIDEYELAKGQNRAAVSVVDFEPRGDVGQADAGAALADALLPLLKPSYDLVPRAAVAKAMADLAIAKDAVDDPKNLAALGKAVKARYLVLGSVGQLAGISVRARLIDTQTGLIVQLGKVHVDSVEDALKRMPELAKQLLMADAEALKAQAPAGQPVAKVADNAAVPPAPPKGAAPPPGPQMNAPPPAVANVQKNAFANLPAAPPNGVVPPAPAPPSSSTLGNRFQVAAAQLGDYYFATGQFAAAQQQYLFALSFDPSNWDVRQRVAQTAPLLPTTSATIMQAIYVPPSLAVMPFYTVGDPSVVPPALSWWTPMNLAPYFAPQYKVADAGIINWYMARVGLSMNDLLTDPVARRWLGRATGVRYFVFGNHLQSVGMDVNTYLVDAELGYVQSAASINVQSLYELKLRLPELAMLTMMTPDQQAAYQLQQSPFGQALAAGLRHMNAGNYTKAVIDFGLGLAMRPDSVQAQVYLIQAQQLASQQGWQEARRQNWLAQQAMYKVAQQRQTVLVQQTQQQSQQAAKQAAAMTTAQREARGAYRFGAAKLLYDNAQQSKNANVSLRLLRGASSFAPAGPLQAAIDQSIAQAQKASVQAEQARLAGFSAARAEAAQTRQRQQLKLAQQQLAQTQPAQQAKLDAFRAAQRQRDDSAAKALQSQGLQLLQQGNFAGAASAFQGAQRFKQDSKLAALVVETTNRQAIAGGKSDAQKKLIEQKLQSEATTQQAATEKNQLAKQKQADYLAALHSAVKALKSKDYTGTIKSAQAALQVMPNDPQATQLLQQAQQAQAALASSAKTQASIKLAVSHGNKAMAVKNYQAAIKAYSEALNLNPNDAGIQQHLKTARQALADAQAAVSYQKAMNAGQAALSLKRYKDAVNAYKDALKLRPNDQQAAAGLQRAEKALTSPKTKTPDTPAPANAYMTAMQKGSTAEKAQRWSDAAQAYAEALKARPKDQNATLGWRRSEYNLHLSQGQQLLNNMSWMQAQAAFEAALRIVPGDPIAIKLLQKAKSKIR